MLKSEHLLESYKQNIQTTNNLLNTLKQWLNHKIMN
jgi:hypothetical protein